MSRLVIAFIDDAQAKTVEKILRDVIDGIPMMGPIDDLDALADAVRDGTIVDHDAAAQVYSADVLARMVAPDLTASVEALAARADELTAECVKVRAAWSNECRRSDDATARADAAESALAAAHARIAELERLAAGPRSAESVDDGLARPFAPETLRGWDADGREVSR